MKRNSTRIITPPRLPWEIVGKAGFALIFWFCILMIATFLLFSANLEARPIVVGVYDNPPKVEIDGNGKPRGIFIDILEYIGDREGWEISYMAGTWDEGLKRLENDSIDLMPDVAMGDIREQRFNFNKLTILGSWLQLFSRRNLVIESLSALEGKTVAILEGSIQEEVINEIGTRLGIRINLVALPDYESTIKMVESGTADALIASRFFGYQREKKGTLIATPIIMNPTNLHFATHKGKNEDILDGIDRHIAVMMDDPHSIYYGTLANWLHEKPKAFIPGYVLWSIVSMAVAILFSLVLVLIFRWLVRKATDELAQKNEELNDALETLRSTYDEAIKRERIYSLGQLALGVAHDFNNLLIPILMYIDVMLENPEELDNKENTRTNLTVIKTAALRGKEIIHRMQQFSKSLKNPEEIKTVDLNSVIGEVIELSKNRLNKTASGGNAVEVVLNLGENCKIVGMAAQLHEMMLNLILNAADAMPQGGHLEITTTNTDGEIVVTVKDSGVGMNEETRLKCLQPFFTTKEEKGTGMGLTMVNNIVKEHGGRIEIVSSVGSGTSFIMTFQYEPLLKI